MLTYWVGSPLTVEAEVEGAGELNLCITASLLPLSPSLSFYMHTYTSIYMYAYSVYWGSWAKH